MSFDVNGFLGSEIKKFSKALYKENEEIFNFCEELNRFSITFRDKLKILEGDERGLFSACLYLRIQKAFQATIILYMKGLSNEAKMITRVSLETLFFLVANLNDDSFLEAVKKSENVMTEKFQKKIINNKIYGRLKNTIKSIREKYETLIMENKDNECNKIEIPDIIKKNPELEYEYYHLYFVLSKDIHVDTRNIKTQYIYTEKDNIVFNCTPNTKDILFIFDTNCHILCRAMKSISRVYCADSENEIERIREKYIEVFDGKF